MTFDFGSVFAASRAPDVRGELSLELKPIGALRTGGRVIVCDPLVSLGGAMPALARDVPVGEHAVELLLATNEQADTRVALARPRRCGRDR